MSTKRGPRYRKIDPRIWLDEWFVGLDPLMKLAWLFVLTSPESTSVGLYRVTPDHISTGLGIESEIGRELLSDLAASKRVLYDASVSLLWVPKWLHYNAPDGTKQAQGYMTASEQFLPHPFARILRMLLTAYLTATGDTAAVPDLFGQHALNDRQALIIRDRVRCVYCKKTLVDVEDVRLDPVNPKGKGGGRSERLVTACRSCSERKSSKTAAEFGHPFVDAKDYTLKDATLDLIFLPAIRTDFSVLFNGLPAVLRDIDSLAHIINEIAPSDRRSDADQTPNDWRSDAERSASDRLSIGERSQEQEQEQEQEQKEPPSGGVKRHPNETILQDVHTQKEQPVSGMKPEDVVASREPRDETTYTIDEAMRRAGKRWDSFILFYAKLTGIATIPSFDFGFLSHINERHVPDRMENEVDRHVKRFLEKGRQTKELTLQYLWECVQHQRSRFDNIGGGAIGRHLNRVVASPEKMRVYGEAGKWTETRELASQEGQPDGIVRDPDGQ